MAGRVKGVNILALVKMLRAAGRERAAAVLPKSHHHYLEERILVSNKYPEEDHVELLRAIARLMPPAPDPWLVLGHGSARSDLNGLYRAHLRPGDPRRTLASAQALWRNYHDTGEMTVAFDGDHDATLRLRAFVAPARELCLINIGYFSELVTMAGGRDVRCVEAGCVVKGAAECSWTVAWR
jgi:uncharacterized protein (TIGR02265 family)